MSEYAAFYAVADEARFGRQELAPEARLIRERLVELGVDPGQPVVELGCGMGALSEVHPGYVGLDLGLPALQRFRSPRPRMQGDMQQLPIATGAIAAVFSWTALEHVPKPELVLAEIERVLRPGGVAVLYPAWYCRPWAAKALPVRPYRELGFRDRITKLSIPIRNSFLWQAAAIFPSRVTRELRSLSGRPTRFDYRRLTPNLETYVYTDCDAFSSLDPHAVITYFRSRKWEIISHPGVARWYARYEPVVIRKPRDNSPHGAQSRAD